MAVSPGWNSQGVKDRLLASADKAGRLPEYVISDNASIMTGGISLAGLAHHRDISHTLGMLPERCYKKERDFIACTKSMSEVHSKHNMTKRAYLLAPRQRTIARFINLSNRVQWSQQMLNVYHNPTPQERAVLAFVPANASLTDELSDVMRCINSIEKDCKQ
jgi:hypothetical protein